MSAEKLRKAHRCRRDGRQTRLHTMGLVFLLSQTGLRSPTDTQFDSDYLMCLNLITVKPKMFWYIVNIILEDV